MPNFSFTHNSLKASKIGKYTAQVYYYCYYEKQHRLMC